MANRWPALVVLLACSSPALSQVVDNPTKKGDKIEFIGLKRWKADDLLQKYWEKNPGKSIHACATCFKEQFGFGDAAVMQYVARDNKGLYTVITLIEPEDAKRVSYRMQIPEAESMPLPEWKEGLGFATSQILQPLVQTFPLILAGKEEEARKLLPRFGVKSDKSEPAWDFLRKHNTRKDHDLAMWVLDHDGDAKHRMLACAVLLNFGDEDSTWWRLADAQRDRNAMVNSIAQTALASLARNRPRAVDWRPALPSLRAVLRGTNLFAYSGTLNVLKATKITSELARDLLADADDLLIAYLRAEHEPSRRSAVEFLNQLSGLEFQTAEQWQEWLTKLQKKG